MVSDRQIPRFIDLSMSLVLKNDANLFARTMRSTLPRPLNSSNIFKSRGHIRFLENVMFLSYKWAWNIIVCAYIYIYIDVVGMGGLVGEVAGWESGWVDGMSGCGRVSGAVDGVSGRGRVRWVCWVVCL